MYRLQGTGLDIYIRHVWVASNFIHSGIFDESHYNMWYGNRYAVAFQSDGCVFTWEIIHEQAHELWYWTPFKCQLVSVRIIFSSKKRL